MSCEVFKQGDWFFLDDWDCLGRVDGFEYSDPSMAYVMLFEEDCQSYTTQALRLKDHKTTKITKEVADIMRGV
jgi:hypothetical protein